jgi:hypothetical protein
MKKGWFLALLVFTMLFRPAAADDQMLSIAKQLADSTKRMMLPEGVHKESQRVSHLPPVAIVISRAMSDDDLLAVMELSHNAPDLIGLVIVGLIDETKAINDTVLEYMEIAKRRDLHPVIYVEPIFAKNHGIKQAPTLILTDENKHLVVSGRTDYKTFLEQLKSQTDEFVNLGTQGSVVEITEKNLMDVMAERAEKLDIQGKAKAAIDRYWARMANKWDLPAVKKDSVRVVDLSVTVPEDLVDEKGRTILRKGQVINPLKLRRFDNAVIVFDGSKPEQVEVAKEMKQQATDMGLIPVLITTRLARPDRNALGDLYEATQSRVFFLDEQFKSRFDIRSVPSMIVPSGGEVRIIEVAP